MLRWRKIQSTCGFGSPREVLFLQHALVIGGSGMLAGACLRLAEQNFKVSVIGRNPHKMKRLCDQHRNIVPVLTDNTDHDDFALKLSDIMHIYGPARLVIAWIHHHDKAVLRQTAKAIRKTGGKDFVWDLFHVLGSSAHLEEIKRFVSMPAECHYHQVQLGFVMEQGHSRWLTHEEISRGVIDAIQKKRKCSVIGRLEPWNMRP